MEPVIKRVLARVRGRRLELLEDVDLPGDCEVNVEIEIPSVAQPRIVEALRASGGVWSADAHPALKTQEDAVHVVRGLGGGFGRRF
jgi:hypothetical protein